MPYVAVCFLCDHGVDELLHVSVRCVAAMVKIEHPFLFWFEEVDRRHNRLRERVKVSGDRLRHTSGMGQAIP